RKKKLPIAAIERAGLAVKNDRGGHYDRFRDRVQFPIIDMTGRVVAFGGRILGDGKPKYMNSPESPVFDKSRVLFGLFQHREAIRKSRRALVVEGNFDLLLLAVHGIDNVVAPLGTALTRNHVRSLRGYCDEVVLLFDGDSAGLKAAMRSVPYFLAEQVEGRVALLPEGHDPDTLVREKGPEGIERLVNGAQPLAEFVFDTLVREHGLTLSGKNKIISELHQLVRDGEDSSQRSLMVAHFSDKLGVSPSQFKVRPAKAQRPAAFEQGQQRLSLDQLPRRQRQLVDFLILYPEFLAELQAVDLASVIDEVAALEIIDHLARLSKDGPCAPEQLMSVVTGERERNYVAELLMRESANDEEHRAGQARRMCNELLAWLRDFQDRRCGADLQCQINEAQRVGDTELLMELLRRKQEAERKRTGF
ncbi:MAG: toprim domain-containing protein, partial [Desulfobulbaceae bacterium]|nr:toprim domain-containing protein [Desulfobulbaceae bacterium]